jgi:predicted nuclease of predicted toxin-antitoxin system
LRFLIDNALSPEVARRLGEDGHDAVHVRDIGMQRASDADILHRAEEEERVVVSADTDFATLLASRRQPTPSIILFRRGAQRRPSEQVALLIANLATIERDLTTGCIAVFEPDRVRIPGAAALVAECYADGRSPPSAIGTGSPARYHNPLQTPASG